MHLTHTWTTRGFWRVTRAARDHVVSVAVILFCVTWCVAGDAASSGVALSSVALGQNVAAAPAGHKPYYTGPSANISLLLDAILQGYDKRLRPEYKHATNSTLKGPPIEVSISMHVISISSISEVDMDFTLDMYFRQYWQDKRLAFLDTNVEAEELIISQEMLDKIWWPDTFFANAKEVKFHKATTNNAFLRIKPTGHITQSLRLTVTAACYMDLTLFPMDSQICALDIESYGYSTEDIVYRWVAEKPIAIEPGVQLPKFRISGNRTEIKLANTSTGSYSRPAALFKFERSLGYYIIQIYIPSCLIVVLSWISFWLHKESAPARVALGITTVLTMTTFVSSTNAALPKLSYLKSIDIFLIFCFFMVFMSIMEYAAVSYMANRSKLVEMKKKERGGPPGDPVRIDIDSELISIKQCRKLANYKCNNDTEVRLSMPMGPPDSCPGPNHCVAVQSQRLPSGECVTVTSRQPRLSLDESDNRKRRLRPLVDLCCDLKPAHADYVDIYARVLFPVVFVVFNTLYWIIYLEISRNDNVLPPNGDL